jgi:hypothetical protein
MEMKKVEKWRKTEINGDKHIKIKDFPQYRLTI